MQKAQKSILSIQINAISKHLQGIKKENILNLSMKIYPVLSSQQSYISLYSAIKRQVSMARAKGVSLRDIAKQLVIKAYAADEQLGERIANLIKQQPQFLSRFQHTLGVTHNSILNNDQQIQQKKQVSQQQNNNQTLKITSQNDKILDDKIPLKYIFSPPQQKFTPVCSPLRNDFFLDSPIIKARQHEFSNNDSSSIYKIGFRNQDKNSQKISKPVDNQFNEVTQNNSNKPPQKTKSPLEQRINMIAQKKKNDIERILDKIEDPLSSARPVTSSPSKTSFFSSTLNNPSQSKGFVFPPPQPKATSFFQPPQSKYGKSSYQKYVESSSLHNLSGRNICLCETACEDIVLSEDSFYCQHCENIYHTRCMRKQPESRNCVICHLRLMTPNRVVCDELFVGLLKKNKKVHEVYFNLSQEMFNFIRSKKDFSYRLQIRCFRLKQQTQNQNLFPDHCKLSINGKELKDFKPLHKQSSLKYRRDEPLSIFKHFQLGDNKITVTEFHTSNGLDRVEPEDHLIGLYLIEQQTLNNTVQRIIRQFVTTLKQSRDLLNMAFHVGDSKSSEEMSQQQVISCQVVKIPLTCALTTQKLNYPARGVFCRHFQCFDLKNYIMMTSSSSNPRWVCPICKASCYEFRIDCILTEILNQYTGCDKVQVLVLYKDGMYEVIDKDEDAIDERGHKLKQPQPKSISDLKIQDRFKRGRQKQADTQYIKLQQAEEKKKKKLLELPPDDQIVSLLSDSD